MNIELNISVNQHCKDLHFVAWLISGKLRHRELYGEMKTTELFGINRKSKIALL